MAYKINIESPAPYNVWQFSQLSLMCIQVVIKKKSPFLQVTQGIEKMDKSVLLTGQSLPVAAVCFLGTWVQEQSRARVSSDRVRELLCPFSVIHGIILASDLSSRLLFSGSREGFSVPWC